MDNCLVMLSIPVVPALASALIAALKRASAIRDALYLVGALAPATASAYLLYAISVLGMSAPSLPQAALLQLAIDPLNLISLAFINCLGAVIALYSLEHVEAREVWLHHVLVLLTMSFASVAVLAHNYVVFALFWLFCTLSLFFAIRLSLTPEAEKAAYKALLILLAADVGMAFSIAYVALTYHTLEIAPLGRLSASSWAIGLVVCLMAVSAIAKAGGVPFHTWIPDVAAEAPTSITALFPASFDKLLGIYKLAVVCYVIASISGGWCVAIAAIGAATMVVGVMMALVQKDIKRLLSFHAISQVGYMIMGVGTGNALGLIGGLFHMVNHSIYKTCLFLTSGVVQRATGTKDIDRLGGLAKKMPVTFVCALVAAMAISGVPPLNGFASKWLIYQAALLKGAQDPVFTVFAVVAAATSALTLASFIKYIHGVFLGPTPSGFEEVRDAGPLAKLAMVVLALLCIALGLFPGLAVKYLFEQPAFGLIPEPMHIEATWTCCSIGVFFSSWAPIFATALALASILLGLAVYAWVASPRPVEPVSEGVKPFVCGEDLLPVFTGGHFYSPLKESLKPLYDVGERGGFDIAYMKVAKAFKPLLRSPKGAAVFLLALYLTLLAFSVYVALWGGVVG